jgi:hypothetical protein
MTPFLCFALAQLDSETAATALILGSVGIGLVWAVSQYILIDQVKLVSAGEEQGLLSGVDGVRTRKLREIYEAIRDGADAFLSKLVLLWFAMQWWLVTLLEAMFAAVGCRSVVKYSHTFAAACSRISLLDAALLNSFSTKHAKPFVHEVLKLTLVLLCLALHRRGVQHLPDLRAHLWSYSVLPHLYWPRLLDAGHVHNSSICARSSHLYPGR